MGKANRQLRFDDQARKILVVVAAQRGAEICAQLERGGLQARRVSEPTDAPHVAAAWHPELVLVDGTFSDATLAHLGAALSAVGGVRFAVLARAASGGIVTVADRIGAELMLEEPLELAMVRKLLAHADGGPPVREPTAAQLPAVVEGASYAMRAVWRFVMTAARSDSSTVVTGETGVGKEVVARALHRFSRRRRGPFIALNCAALPENLLESELFGHEKGAFTGAACQRIGRFEVAAGGTLFLDEIGDLPLGLQSKLLRVLQERCFERLGGNRSLAVDVRVIAATNRDLEEEVANGRFRRDLFYRLNVLSIRVPPLRERKPDIVSLWEHFLEVGADRERRSTPTTSAAAERLLLAHDWPGNIRELQNAAERALTIARSEVTPRELPPGLGRKPVSAGAGRSLVGMTMAEIERAAILETYEALGTVKATARALAISERKIHYRLKGYRDHGPERDDLPVLRSASLEEQMRVAAAVRILLAEDDDDLRWALSDFLVAKGFEVTAVHDANAILEHVGSASVDPNERAADVIISDVRMPGLTGIELLETIRNRGWTRPVVLMSAFGDDAIRQRACSLGATAFLAKPIDTAALQRVILESVH
jgi:DNA-binding NtrC family response regulator